MQKVFGTYGEYYHIFYRLAAEHDIEWIWVRGHSGHHGNERADALANRGVATVQGAA